METKLLHIYGQDAHHDDVLIVGNKEGLTALRDAINQALDNNIGQTPEEGEIMTSDGEGYVVRVSKQDTDWMEYPWKTIMLPYTADWYVSAEKSRDTVNPCDLFKKE